MTDLGQYGTSNSGAVSNSTHSPGREGWTPQQQQQQLFMGYPGMGKPQGGPSQVWWGQGELPQKENISQVRGTKGTAVAGGGK